MVVEPKELSLSDQVVISATSLPLIIFFSFWGGSSVHECTTYKERRKGGGKPTQRFCPKAVLILQVH